MPVGLRGLLLAGIFATAMGSLSTALNALATSFTRDWYEPYINPEATDEQSLRAVRWATVWFSVLMIIVASTTAYLVIVHPNVRIIPIVLGIFGYTYGSLLGVFFAGMLTKTRGNDFGNILAMILGFVVVAILSGLPNAVAKNVRCAALHAAGLAAGDGISVVDLLRNNRHVFGGGSFPDWPRASAAALLEGILPHELMLEVDFKPRAEKDLRNLQRKDQQQRIIDKLRLASDDLHGDIKRLV